MDGEELSAFKRDHNYPLNYISIFHGDGDYEIRLIIDDRSRPPYIKNFFHREGKFYSLAADKSRMVCGDRETTMFDLVDANHDGYGIFYLVNTPQFEMEDGIIKPVRDSAITRINAQFVDIDCMDVSALADKNLLNQWKKNKYNQVMDFDLKPTTVVVTNKGLQVAYKTTDSSLNKFRNIQMQLIKQFQGDEKCINESRFLRCPAFHHLKDPKNPFVVHLTYFHPEHCYTHEQLEKALPKIVEDDVVKIVEKVRKEKTPENEAFLKLKSPQRTRLLDLVAARLNIVSESEDKLICHCCMPDHPDLRPSAWFDKNFMYYHCGSTNCGVHLPLEDLAEKLGWEDVLDEIDNPTYELDVLSKYQEIKNLMVKVKDIPELDLNPEEGEIVRKIAEEVVRSFLDRGQVISEKHQKQIYDIIRILLKGKPSDVPDLIPSSLGSGKSSIIEIFCREIIKYIPDFGGIVVKERVEDVVKFAEAINSVWSNFAYPMYGLQENECQAGNTRCSFTKKLTVNGKVAIFNNCTFKKDCRYFNQFNEQKNYPIVVISHERLLTDSISGKLQEYYRYRKGNQIRTRSSIFIDEKTKLVSIKQLSLNKFNYFKEKISLYLWADLPLVEFKIAEQKIKPLFEYGSADEKRTHIKPVDPDFQFSNKFWTEFDCLNFSGKLKEFPEIIQRLINNGGHRHIKKDDVVITTSSYNKHQYGENYHTVLLDGTADTDLSYKHQDYRIFEFEPIRTYENFTIYKCEYLKSSKTAMKTTISAFCQQVRKIAETHPDCKIYSAVFLDHEDVIRVSLKDLLEQGKVKIDHFGGTKGKNDYLDCDIVTIEGILHKTEDYYIGLYKAIEGNFEGDLSSTNYGKVRRFNQQEIEILKVSDQCCDYVQEIMRSKQRDNSTNVVGKLFIFTDDKELLKILPYKFPGCRIEDWHPEELIKSKVYSSRNKRAKNERILYEYFEKNLAKERIMFEEIIAETGLDKSVLSRLIKRDIVVGIFSAFGFTRIKEGKNTIFLKAHS